MENYNNFNSNENNNYSSSISSPIINGNINSPSPFLNNISPSSNYNNIKGHEGYDCYGNNTKTPVMEIQINNSINENEKQNEQNPNIQNQNSDKINLDTNDSLANIQIEIQPTIYNIVSKVNLGIELNLRNLALQANNAKYEPKKFSAVTMRIKEPKSTANIFSSGKMVCLGAKNEEDSKKACRRFAKILKNLGFPVVFKEFKIINIVGAADLKFQISLIQLYFNLIKSEKKLIHYQPEIFPGLIYHILEPDIYVLIFASGKIILTGGKAVDDIYKAFKKVYPILFKVRIKDGNKDSKLLHRDCVEQMKEIKKGNT